jgi:hypothetical protein
MSTINGSNYLQQANPIPLTRPASSSQAAPGGRNGGPGASRPESGDAPRSTGPAHALEPQVEGGAPPRVPAAVHSTSSPGPKPAASTAPPVDHRSRPRDPAQGHTIGTRINIQV